MGSLNRIKHDLILILQICHGGGGVGVGVGVGVGQSVFL